MENFENYVTSKRDCPCDTCPIMTKCETEFTECSAARKWFAKGDYQDADIQKHIRRAA
jgi:hypothetical protein